MVRLLRKYRCHHKVHSPGSSGRRMCRYSSGQCLATLQPPSMAMPLSMSPEIRRQRLVAQSIQKAWCIIRGTLARYFHYFISDQWAPWTASIVKVTRLQQPAPTKTTALFQVLCCLVIEHYLSLYHNVSPCGLSDLYITPPTFDASSLVSQYNHTNSTRL